MRTPSPYLIRPDGEDMIVVPYMRCVSMRGDPEMAVMGGGGGHKREQLHFYLVP